MLNVACVCVGSEYAPEYVEILYSGIRRNLAAGLRGRFTVFTDNPAAFKDMAGVQPHEVPKEVTGWWAKLYLFSKDAFPDGERVLYFDLDTVLTGPLDAIAAYDGEFAILRDFYRRTGLQSSVMAWRAGDMEGVWRSYVTMNYPDFPGGDQGFIERCFDEMKYRPDKWQDLYPGLFRSYKRECVNGPPKGTSVVVFHGHPRPHECDGWVSDFWKISDSALFFASNVKDEELKANVRYALTKPRWIKMEETTDIPAIIIGGGPSLESELWRVRGHQLSGAFVYATNNTFNYLVENGIQPAAHVMHDARPENIEFVPRDNTAPRYYASQCSQAVLDAAGEQLICWHPHTETCLEAVGDNPKGQTMVSGGSTVGLNAISLAYILGHRRFLLFGFDSCYVDERHHAYQQALNDGDLVLDVVAEGQKFKAAPWMVQQAEQFMDLAKQLYALGCEIFVYGTGLIPTLAANLQPQITAADLRARAVLERLKDVENPVGVEIGVFAGELSRRLLSRTDLKLFMVDSWATEHSPDYATSGDFHARLTKNSQEHFYQLTRNMTKFAGERGQIIRKESTVAAEDFEDKSLDFVFIDADHTYTGCRADILAWLPKIKHGGLMCGHDYDNQEVPNCGVKRAVDEFCKEIDLGENFTWFAEVKWMSHLEFQHG
jgi:uncharacterized Rossmann fold enzyme